MRINSKWEVKKLGEICEVVNGGTPKTNVKEHWNGTNLWITPAEMGKRETFFVEKTVRQLSNSGLKNSSAKLLPPYSVILSSRAPIGHLVINIKPMATNQGCKGLIPSGKLFYLFLYYYLYFSVDYLINLGTGTTFKELSTWKLKEVEIPFPLLSEQKRIVVKLDKFSENIKRLEDIARKNLQNAKDLFNSVLNEAFKNTSVIDGRQTYKKTHWEVKKLGQILTLEYGKPLPDNKRFIEGKYPVYGANGEKSKTNDFLYDKPSIIIGRKGSAGEINLAENKFWPLDVTYFVTFNNNQYYLSFLFWLLHSLNLPKLAKGVKPGINRNEVYNVDVCIPDIRKQKKIAKKLDKLSAETKKLEIVYQKKIDGLAELKKSVLKQTFDCG
ncbi:MAG: restriction endonuclease subunit S [Endomicrobium sp.]|jgi:type I restriction enzyme S subunit|nr:restriction endonuclease subunit S [Endomicrobium sp.]